MLYILFDQVKGIEKSSSVKGIYSRQLSQEMLEEYEMLVEYEGTLIYPDSLINMTPYLRYDFQKKQLYYDYIANETFESRTKSLQEKIKKAEFEVEALQEADLDNKEVINGLGNVIAILLENKH